MSAELKPPLAKPIERVVWDSFVAFAILIPFCFRWLFGQLVKLAMLACLFLVYWVVDSAGVRAIAPDAATKLYKVPIPGFSLLEDYEWTFRLDVAHLLVIVLFAASLFACGVVVRLQLLGDIGRPVWLECDEQLYRQLVLGFAGFALLLDCVVFYCGASAQGGFLGGDYIVSLPTLFLTLAYAVALLGVAAIALWIDMACSK